MKFIIQPIAFGVSFLQSRIWIDHLVSRSLLPRSVEKRPRRLRLKIEVKWHSKCNTLYHSDMTWNQVYHSDNYFWEWCNTFIKRHHYSHTHETSYNTFIKRHNTFIKGHHYFWEWYHTFIKRHHYPHIHKETWHIHKGTSLLTHS